jgi:RNA polymerase sigma-70 factor, ECF subfamily
MPLGPRFESILAAARHGEEWAWREFYDDLAPGILGYLRGQGTDDPEDALGETFLQLARHVGSFRGSEGAFRGWAFLVARNRALDDRRRRRRRPTTPLNDHELAQTGPSGDSEDDAMARLGTARVVSLLHNLTDEQRDVVLLRVVADLPVTEVARLLGKKPGAVKQLLYRALATLRKSLQREGVTA